MPAYKKLAFLPKAFIAATISAIVGFAVVLKEAGLHTGSEAKECSHSCEFFRVAFCQQARFVSEMAIIATLETVDIQLFCGSFINAASSSVRRLRRQKAGEVPTWRMNTRAK